MRKRGQSSVEFTTLISFMFFVFVVFFYLAGSRFAQIKNENDQLSLQDFGDYVKTEVSLAATAADGYARTFAVPLALNGKKYKVEINEYTGTNLNYSEMVISFVNYSLDYSYVMRLPGGTIGDIDQQNGTMVSVRKEGNKIILKQILMCKDQVCNNGETCATCPEDCSCKCPSSTRPCGTSEVGLCEYGTQACYNGIWGECVGAIEATTEICDGLDNDCDDSTDEELGSTTCGVGACLRTVPNCENGVTQECVPGIPVTEICTDSIDDDCNGIIETNLCSPLNSKMCISSTTYKLCGNHDADPCLEWSTSTYICPGGYSCLGDECVLACTNECSPSGAKVCTSPTTYALCGNYDADSCLELGSPITCSGGMTCSGGRCI